MQSGSEIIRRKGSTLFPSQNHESFSGLGWTARSPVQAHMMIARGRRRLTQHQDRQVRRVYGRMHKGIVSHAVRLGFGGFHLLDHIDFCLFCADDGRVREAMIRELERPDLPFIDTGVGFELAPAGLAGAVRVTTSLPDAQAHVWECGRIPTKSGGADDLYKRTSRPAS